MASVLEAYKPQRSEMMRLLRLRPLWLVTLLLESPGVSLTAQGRALEAAARGAAVPVMNLASRNIVEGIAVAPGRVRVAMGTIPMAAR